MIGYCINYNGMHAINQGYKRTTLHPSEISTNALVVMGVSGTGKTTLGLALAKALAWQFVEGDDYHPQANLEKMRQQIALDDADRWPWLEKLHEVLKNNLQQGIKTVLSCSALKKTYRDKLVEDMPGIEFVYLCGDADMILKRLHGRKDHFMPPGLLDSQIASLEPPLQAIFVPIDLSTDKQVDAVIKQLQSMRYR